MKGKMGEGTKAGLIIGVFAIIGIMLFSGGFLSGFAPTGAGVVGSVATTTTPTGQVVSKDICSGINTLQLFAAARNPLNNSLYYTGADFRVDATSDGTQDEDGTGTAGTSRSATTLDVPCTPANSLGTVYVMSSTTLNSNKKLYSFEAGTGQAFDILQTTSGQARFTMYGSTGATNTSVQSATTSETAATAFSAGDTRSGKVDIDSPSNQFSQYGGHVMLDDLPALKPYISFNPGLVWYVDTVDAAAFTDNALGLSSQDGSFPLVEIPLDVCNSVFGKGASVDSANRCYVSPSFATGRGTTRLAYTLSNDAGTNAGSTSDPVVYVEDLQYFLDTDGTIKIGTHDSASTNVGETQSTITWNNS